MLRDNTDAVVGILQTYVLRLVQCWLGAVFCITSKILKLKGKKKSPASCFLNSLVTIQNPFKKLKVAKTNSTDQDCNTMYPNSLE